MSQSLDELPDDGTGDALRRLRDDGADLSKPHKIDFHIAVPNETAGLTVLEYAQAHGFEADLDQDEETSEWTCWCSKIMIPSHAAITKVYMELDRIAQPVGGYADGWGAFPVR